MKKADHDLQVWMRGHSYIHKFKDPYNLPPNIQEKVDLVLAALSGSAKASIRGFGYAKRVHMNFGGLVKNVTQVMLVTTDFGKQLSETEDE